MVHFIFFSFQDKDCDDWSYKDNEKDKTVEFKDIEIREGIERLDKFSQAAVGKTEEFVSKSGFRKLRKRVRSKEKRNYERKYRRLRVFKFDGKISWNSVGKGKKVKKTNITVMTEPENKYVDHFSCRDNGLNVGTGLWKCIEETDSVDTVEALGCYDCTVNTSPKVGAVQFVKTMLGQLDSFTNFEFQIYKFL